MTDKNHYNPRSLESEDQEPDNREMDLDPEEDSKSSFFSRNWIWIAVSAALLLATIILIWAGLSGSQSADADRPNDDNNKSLVNDEDDVTVVDAPVASQQKPEPRIPVGSMPAAKTQPKEDKKPTRWVRKLVYPAAAVAAVALYKFWPWSWASTEETGEALQDVSVKPDAPVKSDAPVANPDPPLPQGEDPNVTDDGNATNGSWTWSGFLSKSLGVSLGVGCLGAGAYKVYEYCQREDIFEYDDRYNGEPVVVVRIATKEEARKEKDRMFLTTIYIAPLMLTPLAFVIYPLFCMIALIDNIMPTGRSYVMIQFQDWKKSNRIVPVSSVTSAVALSYMHNGRPCRVDLGKPVGRARRPILRSETPGNVRPSKCVRIFYTDARAGQPVERAVVLRSELTVVDA